MGAGYTWPGHVALTLYPTLFSSTKLRFPKGIVFISGTNGKTTTAKLLTHFLNANGLKVTHNNTGANLVNGIASAILLDMNWRGNLTSERLGFVIYQLMLPFIF